jgi:phosphonate transport system permease protein
MDIFSEAPPVPKKGARLFLRSASVLGLIGAGGIGYLMNTSFRTFQYQEAAAIVLVLVVLVMVVDYGSSRLREWVV